MLQYTWTVCVHANVCLVFASMVGVELFSERKAEEFMEKYQHHVLRGQKLSLEFYNVRLNRFDKNMKRHVKKNPEPGES